MTVKAFFAIIFMSVTAHAQQSLQLMCKKQAKDMAVKIYSDCMEENQKAQLEQLKAQYKAEMAAMKNKFESKLKAVKNGEIALSEGPKVTMKQASKPVKGVAKTLPSKAPVSGDVESVQSVQVSEPVLTTQQNSMDLEQEAEQLEVVDLPAVE